MGSPDWYVSMFDISFRKFLGMYCPEHTGVTGNDRADRLAGKATITAEEIETLPAGTKPRSTHHRSHGGERRGNGKHSMIFLGTRQTLQLCQRQRWETSERLHMGFSGQYHLKLNWIELDLLYLFNNASFENASSVNAVIQYSRATRASILGETATGCTRSGKVFLARHWKTPSLFTVKGLIFNTPVFASNDIPWTVDDWTSTPFRYHLYLMRKENGATMIMNEDHFFNTIRITLFLGREKISPYIGAAWDTADAEHKVHSVEDSSERDVCIDVEEIKM